MVADESGQTANEPEDLSKCLAKLQGCRVERYVEVLDDEQEKVRCGLLAGLNKSQAACLGNHSERSGQPELPSLPGGVIGSKNKRHKQRLFVQSLEQNDNSDGGDSTDGNSQSTSIGKHGQDDEGVRIVNLRDLKEGNFTSVDRDNAPDKLKTAGIGNPIPAAMAFEAKEFDQTQHLEFHGPLMPYSQHDGSNKHGNFQPTPIDEGPSEKTAMSNTAPPSEMTAVSNNGSPSDKTAMSYTASLTGFPATSVSCAEDGVADQHIVTGTSESVHIDAQGCVDTGITRDMQGNCKADPVGMHAIMSGACGSNRDDASLFFQDAVEGTHFLKGHHLSGLSGLPDFTFNESIGKATIGQGSVVFEGPQCERIESGTGISDESIVVLSDERCDLAFGNGGSDRPGMRPRVASNSANDSEVGSMRQQVSSRLDALHATSKHVDSAKGSSSHCSEKTCEEYGPEDTNALHKPAPSGELDVHVQNLNGSDLLSHRHAAFLVDGLETSHNGSGTTYATMQTASGADSRFLHSNTGFSAGLGVVVTTANLDVDGTVARSESDIRFVSALDSINGNEASAGKGVLRGHPKSARFEDVDMQRTACASDDVRVSSRIAASEANSHVGVSGSAYASGDSRGNVGLDNVHRSDRLGVESPGESHVPRIFGPGDTLSRTCFFAADGSYKTRQEMSSTFRGGFDGMVLDGDHVVDRSGSSYDNGIDNTIETHMPIGAVSSMSHDPCGKTSRGEILPNRAETTSVSPQIAADRLALTGQTSNEIGYIAKRGIFAMDTSQAGSFARGTNSNGIATSGEFRSDVLERPSENDDISGTSNVNDFARDLYARKGADSLTGHGVTQRAQLVGDGDQQTENVLSCMSDPSQMSLRHAASHTSLLGGHAMSSERDGVLECHPFSFRDSKQSRTTNENSTAKNASGVSFGQFTVNGLHEIGPEASLSRNHRSNRMDTNGKILASGLESSDRCVSHMTFATLGTDTCKVSGLSHDTYTTTANHAAFGDNSGADGGSLASVTQNHFSHVSQTQDIATTGEVFCVIRESERSAVHNSDKSALSGQSMIDAAGKERMAPKSATSDALLDTFGHFVPGGVQQASNQISSSMAYSSHGVSSLRSSLHSSSMRSEGDAVLGVEHASAADCKLSSSPTLFVASGDLGRIDGAFRDSVGATPPNGHASLNDNLRQTATFGEFLRDSHLMQSPFRAHDSLRETATFGECFVESSDVAKQESFSAMNGAAFGVVRKPNHGAQDIQDHNDAGFHVTSGKEDFSHAKVNSFNESEPSEPMHQAVARRTGLRGDDGFVGSSCTIAQKEVLSVGPSGDASWDNRGFMRGLMKQLREYGYPSSRKMSRSHSIEVAEGIHERVMNHPGASIPSVGYSSRAVPKASHESLGTGCSEPIPQKSRRLSPQLSDSNSNSRRRRARSDVDGLLDRARARLSSPLRNGFGQQSQGLGIGVPKASAASFAKAEDQMVVTPKESLPPPAESKSKGVGKGKAAPPPKKAVPPPPKKAGPKASATAKVDENLRKPDVKPHIPLKKLYWSSFRLKDPGKNTIWDEIDMEGANIDTTELEKQFSDQVEPKATATPIVHPSRKVRKIQVLDEQRRRQVSVMLPRLPDNQTVHVALMTMDKSKLNKDQVDLLLHNLPSLEEIKLMRNAQETHVIDEFNVWDLAEEFMIFLIAIPQFQLRLEVWDFENGFGDRLHSITTSAGDLERACDVVLQSQSLKKLLGIILMTGNYLNGGTARGRADGFAIDTLVQMRTVKMSQAPGDNRPGSLVDYIARQMDKQFPLEFEHMLATDKEMGCIKVAARYNLVDLLQELLSVKNKTEQMLAKMKLPKRAEEQLELDAFEDHAETLSECIVHLTEQHERLKSVEGKYSQLCTWFHMEGNATKTTDDFFSIWDRFLADIIQARKSWQDQEKQEAIKRARSAITSRGLTPLGRRRTVGNLDTGNIEEKKTRSATPRRNSVQTASVFSRLRRSSVPSAERHADSSANQEKSYSQCASPEQESFSRSRVVRTNSM